MTIVLKNGLAYVTKTNIVAAPNDTLEWLNEAREVMTIHISQLKRIEP